MFWRFNNMCTTNIDNILNEEDVTLQRLMDEDDIIQECKSSNRKLINFLTKPEVLHELVNLVTVEPSTQMPDATRFKYNNIASELFSCDVTAINDALVADESLLAELCDFLNGDPPLNPLMASFFSKTMAVLIGRKADKMLEYLKTREGFLPRLFQNLRTSAIMDFVLKLVTCVENKESRIEIAQWLIGEQFVENLIALLSGGSEPELHGNAAQLLCDLLRLLRDMYAQNVASEMSMGTTDDRADSGETADHSEPILIALESKATVDKLLDHMLSGELGESSIVHGVTVLLTLLEVRKPPQLMNSEPEVFERTPPDPVVTPCIRNTVEALIPRLKDFHDILLNPPKKVGSELPEGACRHPLGFVRSQVTRLIAALIATGSSEVQKELAALGTLTLLLEMVVDFSHNNFLHAQVERSIQHIMGLEPVELLQPSTQTKTAEDETSGGSDQTSEQPTSPTHPLLAHLMTETCLVRRIMEAWELNEQQQNQIKGLRKAYMGHLIRIANYVVDFGKQGKNSAKIQQLMLNLPEDLRTQWEEFVDTKLAQANRNNEIIPVTSSMVAPRASSDEEDSDVIRLPRDTAAQESFAAYQMEVMTKQVVAQFGFADNQFQDNEDQLRPPQDALVNIALPDDVDELTQQSNLFERACNERLVIKRDSGEEDEDDETWLQRGHKRDSENPSTVRHTSSSDEEGTDDANDSMDVDSVDPWAAPALDAAPVALDAGNPWDSAPAASSADQQDDNWANFGKADFDPFATASSAPMEVSDSPSAAPVEDMSPPTEKKEGETSAPEGSDPSASSSTSPDRPNGPV